MTALLAASLLLTPATIERDGYGVPHIQAESFEQAFEQFGQAVAEDRLWQMETSRLVARGRYASLVGEPGVASDTATLKTGYTDEELAAMVEALPEQVQEAFEAYARGVNARIMAGDLPEQYGRFDYEPEPWTVVDSAAIYIMLAKRFGVGGAGEIRNLAILKYLENQPAQESRLDIFDDLLWQNDSTSPTTVPPGDGPPAPALATWTRADTERQLADMPNVNLFELLPAIQLADLEDQKLVAQSVAAPFKVGSYAILVPKESSATGVPLLLNGPQMGFTLPSVVHEISVTAPGYTAAGMNVPGIPGVLVGKTPHLAWGLTSGVADTRDVYYSMPNEDGTGYVYGEERRPITSITRTLEVKGGEAQTVTQKRTHYGPVVLESRSTGAIFSMKSSHWMKELESLPAIFSLGAATTLDEVAAEVPNLTLSFNLFVATVSGETGYWYCGLFPNRADGFDQRLPLPGVPDSEWDGMLAESHRPQVLNPTRPIVNWNNKPIGWWPNSDTPVWGEVFRSHMLSLAIPTGRLTQGDLERAIWMVARQDTLTNGRFLEIFQPIRALEGPLAKYVPAMDAWQMDGAVTARIYVRAVDALRRELFLQHTGNFLTPDLFAQAAQPSVMLKALARRTKFDYLDGRPAQQVVHAALLRALSTFDTGDPDSWRFDGGAINLAGIDPIPYSNRGTYIQITSLEPGTPARSVLPPGNAESGEHALDQANLARSWTYKPMK